MKSNYAVLKFPDRIKWIQRINSNEPGLAANIGKHLRKIIYISSIAGTALVFSGCATGYVVTEPSYVEYSRPQRPSDLHIWVNGDWVFNRQSHAYVQRNGYWASPNQGRVYVTGQWQTTPKGKYWTKGHWQKNGRQKKQH
jgi:hypothetical protein